MFVFCRAIIRANRDLAAPFCEETNGDLKERKIKLFLKKFGHLELSSNILIIFEVCNSSSIEINE